tara:strand:+ start:647 stop:1375 length:729 start_codon:yes stop_codon:yes gene_type:complete
MDQVTQTVVSGLAEYPVGTITATLGSSADLVIGNTITGQTSNSTAIVLTKPSATTVTLSIPSGSFTAGETIASTASDESGVTTTITADPSVSDVSSSIDILSAVIRRSGSDISIVRISRDDFLSIPSKTTPGRPIQYYVDRQIKPVVKVFPTPENSTDIIVYDRLVRIDDADASGNTVEIPFRFYPCLAAGLSYYMSLKIAPDRTLLLKNIYEEEFTRAAEEDRDRSSFSVVPAYNYLSALS